MLDTNVVLDIMKNRTKAFEKLKEFKGFTFIISYMVYVEVMAGSQLTDKKDTRKFLSEFFIVNKFDEAAHSESKKFVNKYFTGKENKPMDLLIASHAKALNIPIITKNSKDFIFSEIEVYHYDKSIKKYKDNQ